MLMMEKKTMDRIPRRKLAAKLRLSIETPCEEPACQTAFEDARGSYHVAIGNHYGNIILYEKREVNAFLRWTGEKIPCRAAQINCRRHRVF
jgi:hypothetical protein